MFSTNIFAQKNAVDILNWQDELNKEYADKSTSPLSDENRVVFKRISFFAKDTAYTVNAIIILSKTTDEIPFATSTNRVITHKEYSTLNLLLKGNNIL